MKNIIIILLFMLTILSFGYVHVYSYQDFTDYENGELIKHMIIPSNDDGTHGFHDRWGPNKEFTFDDVPGDTDIYLDTEKQLVVLWDEDGAYLMMDCEEGVKTTMGLKEIPNPIRLNIMIYYDFYLDTSSTKEYSFVMFSTDLPGTIGRIWAEYRSGVFHIFRRTGRYSVSEIFSKAIDLEDEWLQFKLELTMGRNFRFAINGGTITSMSTNKYYEEIPYYFIGNWVDKNKYSPCDVKIKTFVVAHNK